MYTCKSLADFILIVLMSMSGSKCYLHGFQTPCCAVDPEIEDPYVLFF